MCNIKSVAKNCRKEFNLSVLQYMAVTSYITKFYFCKRIGLSDYFEVQVMNDALSSLIEAVGEKYAYFITKYVKINLAVKELGTV